MELISDNLNEGVLQKRSLTGVGRVNGTNSEAPKYYQQWKLLPFLRLKRQKEVIVLF